MTKKYVKWNYFGYNSFQESHNSRKRREIAEKQIEDSKKFSLFAERKYQTLVSIFQKLCIFDRGWEEGLPQTLAVGQLLFLFSPELQCQRELREHTVPAPRAGQQGLCRFALEVMEQHFPGGVALPRGCPPEVIGHLLGCFLLP